MKETLQCINCLYTLLDEINVVHLLMRIEKTLR